MTQRLFYRIMAFITGSIGFFLIFHYYNWKLALAILLILWGNNLDKLADNTKN